LGLTHADKGAGRLAAAGSQVLCGSQEDLEPLKRGTPQSDGVIHTAFNRDFSKFVQNFEDDRVLEGSGHPLLVTSGVALLAHGEQMAAALAPRRVRTSTGK
jgi:hypothetical protein